MCSTCCVFVQCAHMLQSVSQPFWSGRGQVVRGLAAGVKGGTYKSVLARSWFLSVSLLNESITKTVVLL